MALNTEVFQQQLADLQRQYQQLQGYQAQPAQYNYTQPALSISQGVAHQVQKEDYPDVADLLSVLANEELKHMQMLHNMVVKIIGDYRKLKGDPPAAMQAVYDYIHEQMIEKEKEVKILQQMYMEK